MQEHRGFISDLELQPKFILQEKFSYKGKVIRAITFKADFKYLKKGEVIIEEVKGGNATKTEAYRIRKKLLLKRYPDINFIET